MRFRRLSTGAWKISPCNTYLPAAPGYVMVESRQLARLKAERQKNHQLKVRMSDSIKQNSQFSLPLNFAPTTGTTACEAIHWTPSMDTLPRPALAPPPSPATTPSPATAPAETPGPVSAMSVSLSVPPAPAGFIDLDGADNQLSRITWVAEAVAHGCSSNGSIAVIRGRLKEKLQSRHMRQTTGYGNSRSSFTYLHTFPSPNIRPPSLNELMPPPMPPPPPPPPPTLPMPPTTMPTLPTTAASSPARTHQAATHAPSPLPAPAPAKKRHAPPKSPPRVESPPQPPPSQERRKRTAREQQQPQHEPLLVPAQSRSRSGRLLTTMWQSRAGLGFKRD